MLALPVNGGALCFNAQNCYNTCALSWYAAGRLRTRRPARTESELFQNVEVHNDGEWWEV
jgi:hypothetical protein